MYRIGVFAADMLNSIDNVAKETLEGDLLTSVLLSFTLFVQLEPKESSTSIRMKKKNENEVIPVISSISTTYLLYLGTNQATINTT